MPFRILKSYTNFYNVDAFRPMPKQYISGKGSDANNKCLTDASIAQKLLEFNKA